MSGGAIPMNMGLMEVDGGMDWGVNSGRSPHAMLNPALLTLYLPLDIPAPALKGPLVSTGQSRSPLERRGKEANTALPVAPHALERAANAIEYVQSTLELNTQYTSPRLLRSSQFAAHHHFNISHFISHLTIPRYHDFTIPPFHRFTGIPFIPDSSSPVLYFHPSYQKVIYSHRSHKSDRNTYPPASHHSIGLQPYSRTLV